MAINFSFSLSLDAAKFLIGFHFFCLKNKKYNIRKTEKNVRYEYSSIPKGVQFIKNAQSLQRQGFIYHERDNKGKVVDWQITPKGKLMAELLILELEDAKSSINIGEKVVKKINKKIEQATKELGE